MSGLLAPGEGDPVIVVNGAGRSRFFLVCEHAGRGIPRRLGRLGLPEAELERHIAWDIGAAGVSRHLSRILDAPLAMQRYSRLVYDCNRPPHSPGAMPPVSETTEIPGNRNLSDADRQARIDSLYKPFHAKVEAMLEPRGASVFVAIHSFTPVYKGQVRDLDLGILHGGDRRLADTAMAAAEAAGGIRVRRNEPYGPEDGVYHTVDLHATPRGLLNAMIEIRNDLIAGEAEQQAWAERLAGILERALAMTTKVAAA